MLRRILWAIVLNACAGEPAIPAEHRAVGAVCEAGRATWKVVQSPYVGPYADTCKAHQDCTEGADGRCTTLSSRGASYLACTYHECLSDDDCAGVCTCAGAGEQDHHQCLPPGNCKIDADCGEEFCSPSLSDCGPGWGTLGHFCHTSRDRCRDHDDCGSDVYDGYCAYDEVDERWACREGVCVGR